MLVIAHRGASATHPENTLEAFGAAAADGADGVELDLRRTADGRVAVRHDPFLPDGRLLVELARADIPAWVPGLDEVLAACAGFEVVNLEIKNSPADPDHDPADTLAEVVVAALAGRADLRDRVLVSSFHLPTVDRVRALEPAIATGWLTVAPRDPVEVVEVAAARGHRAIHPHVAVVDAVLVERAHQLDLAVTTWTVDDGARLRELARLGVDAAITNDPAGARAALAR